MAFFFGELGQLVPVFFEPNEDVRSPSLGRKPWKVLRAANIEPGGFFGPVSKVALVYLDSVSTVTVRAVAWPGKARRLPEL